MPVDCPNADRLACRPLVQKLSPISLKLLTAFVVLIPSKLTVLRPHVMYVFGIRETNAIIWTMFKTCLKQIVKTIFSLKRPSFGFQAVCIVVFWPRYGQILKKKKSGVAITQKVFLYTPMCMGILEFQNFILFYRYN